MVLLSSLDRTVEDFANKNLVFFYSLYNIFLMIDYNNFCVVPIMSKFFYLKQNKLSVELQQRLANKNKKFGVDNRRKNSQIFSNDIFLLF